MRGVRAIVTFCVVTILCDVHVVCVAIGYPTLFVSDAIVYDAIERVKFCAWRVLYAWIYPGYALLCLLCILLICAWCYNINTVGML